MRRDMELVRRILREVADAPEPLDGSALATDSHGIDAIAYHAEIMAEAGLLRCDCKRAWDSGVLHLEVGPLTWAGNDLLDSISNDSVWSATKLRIAKTVGSAALDVVKAVAVSVAREMLNV